jgi:hypothetical protein
MDEKDRNGCVGVSVRDLIAYLQTQPQDAEMLIDDADTHWFLPLKIGHDEHHGAPKAEWLLPQGAVIVRGDYGEDISYFERAKEADLRKEEDAKRQQEAIHKRMEEMEALAERGRNARREMYPWEYKD